MSAAVHPTPILRNLKLQFQPGLAAFHRPVTRLVIHHSATVDVSAAVLHRNALRTGKLAGTQYHAHIRRDGAIELGRPWHLQAAHGVLELNQTAMAVCLLGNFEHHAPEPEQLVSLRWLLALWRWLYPDARVSGHREHQATLCPGRLFPLEEFRS